MGMAECSGVARKGECSLRATAYPPLRSRKSGATCAVGYFLPPLTGLGKTDGWQGCDLWWRRELPKIFLGTN